MERNFSKDDVKWVKWDKNDSNVKGGGIIKFHRK